MEEFGFFLMCVYYDSQMKTAVRFSCNNLDIMDSKRLLAIKWMRLLRDKFVSESK